MKDSLAVAIVKLIVGAVLDLALLFVVWQLGKAGTISEGAIYGFLMTVATGHVVQRVRGGGNGGAGGAMPGVVASLVFGAQQAMGALGNPTARASVAKATALGALVLTVASCTPQAMAAGIHAAAPVVEALAESLAELARDHCEDGDSRAACAKKCADAAERQEE